MKALIVSSTLLITIFLCVALGVGCGYAAVSGILRAFSRSGAKPKTAAAHLHAAQAGD